MTFLSPKGLQINTTQASDIEDSVLILIENNFDRILAEEISIIYPSVNFTVQNIQEINNISEFISENYLDKYISIFFIFSSNLKNIGNSSITMLNQISNNGTSIVVLSSKIWQINLDFQNLLGISSPEMMLHEYHSNQSKNLTLTVMNDTLLKEPFLYNSGQNITFNANIGVIEGNNSHIVELLRSEDLNSNPNNTIFSGVYLKETSNQSGLFLSIPLTLQDENDNELIKIITSLSYYVIDWSYQIFQSKFNDQKSNADNTTTSQQTTSTLQQTTTTIDTTQQENPISTTSSSDRRNFIEKQLVVPPEISQGIIATGALSILGISTFKAVNVIRKKEEEDEISDKKDETWSIDQNWLVGLLVIVISFFGALIHSSKFTRLTVFQVHENVVRQEIIKVLEMNGFDHFNSLQKKVNTGVSILLWHLSVLEDFNIIKTEKFGQFKVIYLTNSPPKEEEVTLYFKIRSKIALNIIKHFLKSSNWSIDVLAGLLSSSHELVRYHCNKLEKLGVLKYYPKSKSYFLHRNKTEILNDLLARNNLN
ncbi:MAG: hypothetical protein ACXAC7_22905 [Candidatus Hodarchaeales archaeon]|jgi:predicted transcriptional regulator